MILRRCFGGFVAFLLLATGACDDTTGLSGSAPPTESPSGEPLAGLLLFSLFDEASHTFESTHVSRPDGTGEIEILMPGSEGGGRWSRSGDEIAVMAERRDGRVGTAVIAPTGEVLRVLDIPDDALNLVCTVWSPDDQRLACEGFDETDPDRGGIYTVRADDGRGLVRLTRPPDGSTDLPGDYSPDGRTFLFKRGSGDEGPGPLMSVPAEGGEALRFSDTLVEDPGRYSPDGRTVLTSAEGEIVLLDENGERAGGFGRDGEFMFGPVWSPDGSHIAYSSATSGTVADIYTARPDGTSVQQVTSTPDNEIRVEWGTF
jgi:Tol biopolymer transport system component